MDFKKHIVTADTSIKEALEKLDVLAQDAILFLVDETEQLIGSVTDGDIRRGLIQGRLVNESVSTVAKQAPKFIRKNENAVEQIKSFRERNLKIIPVLEDQNNRICDIINFRIQTTKLPIEAVIMAGGEGRRLRPLTENTPKPLLKVGSKPIIEHTIDRLNSFGLDNIWLSVNYLADQLELFAQQHPKKSAIHFIHETTPLGTIGSVSLVDNFQKDVILVSNSDLLTNVDFEAFFLDFMESNALMSVVSIPYKVDIPYAVLELENGYINNLKEKPTYTYYSNGGIYLIKKEALQYIPKNTFFGAPDLMEALIQIGKSVRSFPHHGYWLDIGKHDDFKRAQEDVHIYEW